MYTKQGKIKNMTFFEEKNTEDSQGNKNKEYFANNYCRPRKYCTECVKGEIKRKFCLTFMQIPMSMNILCNVLVILGRLGLKLSNTPRYQRLGFLRFL